MWWDQTRSGRITLYWSGHDRVYKYIYVEIDEKGARLELDEVRGMDCFISLLG